MPAEGFRAAQAYVEVTARLDEGQLLATARRAGEGMESALQESGERAGSSLTDVLGRAGDDAGQAVVRSTEGRLRDGKGRFLAAGSEVGKGIGKGAEDESHRNGFRSFLGLIGAAPKAGLEASKGLVGALSQGLKGPAGPYLIAGLTAGAVTAGPFVGALLAGGIIAGIATAGIGAGVIIAAKDPAVKHAWAQTGDQIGDILQDAASPFRAELIEAASRGSAAFERWQPMFHQIFGVASTMLDPFVDAAEYAGDRLLPTIMITMNAARPAVDALSSGIKGTVDAVADVVDMLGDNGPEAAVALHVAFLILQGNIRNVGAVVNGLTEAFGWLLEKGLSFLEWLASVGQDMQGLPGPLGDIGDKLAGLGPVTDGWRNSWEGLKTQMAGATEAGSEGTSKLSERTQFLSLSMGAAIEKAGGLSAAFKLLNGGALNAREAESAYQAAIDNVTASMQANGKTLDLRTEKGRANDAALRQLITTTDQKAQATYDETLATKGAAAAEAAASGVYAQGREQLIKSAMQMGLNRKKAEEYADGIMKIPKTWNTKATADTAGATAAITSFHKFVTQKDGTVIDYVVRVTKTGDHYIPGQGTQTKAAGGEVTGGTGWRDDVPVLAMGGEWVIQKRAVEALERQFGPDFMGTLNTWHQGGRGSGQAKVPTKPGRLETGVDGLARPVTWGKASESHVTHIGQVVLDASRMKSIQDVVDLISNFQTSARSLRARTATMAGR